eukprot:scaffold48573_cov64-Phaeocystis_antarctica.AAC.1
MPVAHQPRACRAYLTAYRVAHRRHRRDGRHAAARCVPDGNGRGRGARARAAAARAACEPRPRAGGRAGTIAAFVRQRQDPCVDTTPGVAWVPEPPSGGLAEAGRSLGSLRHDLALKEAFGGPAA